MDSNRTDPDRVHGSEFTRRGFLHGAAAGAAALAIGSPMGR